MAPASTSPGPPGDDLSARITAATALRELGHAFVAHDIDPAFLHTLTADVERLAERVRQNEPRIRAMEHMKQRMFDVTPADGMPMHHIPDCVVSGLANPMGIAVRTHREGNDAVAHVVIDSAFEGAPGRAHGGIVAAILDDLMGSVLSIIKTPAYTGRLTVHYRAPTPVHTELEFRCHLTERDGRKLHLRGTVTDAGRVIVEAEGLFITIPPEAFGAATVGQHVNDD